MKIAMAVGLLLLCPAVNATVWEGSQSGEYFGKTHVLSADTVSGYLGEINDKCQNVDENCKPGNDLLDKLFGPDFVRHDLADFVVDLEADAGGVWTVKTSALLTRHRNSPHLVGVSNLYVVVFARSLKYKDQKPKLKAGLSIEAHHASSSLRAALKFAGFSPKDDESKDEIKDVDIGWQPLSGNADEPEYWIGIAKLPIPEDVVGRVTLFYPADEKKDGGADEPRDKITVRTACENSEKSCELAKAKGLVIDLSEKEKTSKEKEKEEKAKEKQGFTNRRDFISTGAHFSNSYDDRFGISVAGGLVFHARGTKLQSSQGNQSASIYGFAKYYLIQPRLNVSEKNWLPVRPSLGIAVGTNVSHTKVTQLIAGVSAGHVFGPLGFIAGGAWVPTEPVAPETESKRVWKAFFALDYTF